MRKPAIVSERSPGALATREIKFFYRIATFRAKELHVSNEKGRGSASDLGLKTASHNEMCSTKLVWLPRRQNTLSN